MPASPRNSVDLPAPFGPTTASSAPGGDLAIEVMHRRMAVIAERDVAEFDLRGHAHLIATSTTAHSAALTASAAARRAVTVMRRIDQGAACAGCGVAGPWEWAWPW